MLRNLPKKETTMVRDRVAEIAEVTMASRAKTTIVTTETEVREVIADLNLQPVNKTTRVTEEVKTRMPNHLL